MKIKGTYKKCIFSSDDGYTVGLLKVKDDSEYNDKTITFTGVFANINLDNNLVLEGNFVHHNKYGEQFNVTIYEVSVPDNENGIISFLSSDLFKGIGENKARKIYETLGDNTIEIIINNPDSLKEIKGLTKKNIINIYETLLNYHESIDTIIYLNEYGFTTKESNYLYHLYKSKVIDLLKEDIYSLINDNISFKRIDILALNHEYQKNDIRRVKACIIYVFNEVIVGVGDTYLLYDELYGYLKRALNYNIDNDLYDEALISLINKSLVINIDNKYYLSRMYEAEYNISKRFVYLNNLKENNYKNLDNLLLSLEEENNINYNDDQLMAIKKAFTSNFLIITGGPGTGKTTIIKSIVTIYQKLFKVSNRDIVNEITLLAPTGRASKRMMEVVNIPSQTIHRFLKWNKEKNKFGVNEYNKVNTKLVIVDEASMIDTYLLDSLLRGLYYDTKVILVGDVNQLPSVGSGQVLKDLIDSNMFNVVKLNMLYRQSGDSNIINLSHDINEGIMVDDYFNQDESLTFMECDSYTLMDKFSELCLAYKDYPYNDFIILAPMYKTINGIDNLNMIAQNIFNPADAFKKEIVIGDTKYRVGDKVIELVNMPDDNIYNGDIGIIKEIDPLKKEVYILFDDNLVKFTKSNFANFKLGYVISIHKSQGSEFNVVIITCLMEYNRMLYRKLYYTGITRCKKNLFILGEKSALNKAILNNNLVIRKTSLMEMVNKMYE